MKDLAKVEPSTLTESFQDYVLKGVSVELRKSASDAVAWFESFPSGQDRKYDLLGLQLAGYFHAVNATPEEIAAACIHLGRKTKWRPGVQEYLDAIEDVRTMKRAKEIAGYEIYTMENGDRVFCTDETGRGNNWTKAGF